MPLLQDSNNSRLFVGTNLQTKLYEIIRVHNPESVLVVCDSNTYTYCYQVYEDVFSSISNLKVLSIVPGEDHKSIESAALIWDELLNLKGGRNSLVIALGGGMICDLAAFSASVFMRGVSFILMPTTLLAMVDAAIGGKTAVNYHEIKNTIGTFTQAGYIVADYGFLNTLPEKELNSGKAEMLKHALLESEDALNSFIGLKTIQPEDILKSMRFKQKIVSEDFKENAFRESLNLGHTVAHALESLYIRANKTLLHGEAVAAGLMIESYISMAFFNLQKPLWFDKLHSYINESFPKILYSEIEIPVLVELMSYDKKNKAGRRSFTLLKAPGNVITGCQPVEEVLVDALNLYLKDA